MPRQGRTASDGLVLDMLNRVVARLALFEKVGDYQTFERVLAEAQEKHPTRLRAFTVMPNHWHLVVWPETDCDPYAMFGYVEPGKAGGTRDGRGGLSGSSTS